MSEITLLVGASKRALPIPSGFFPYRSFRGRYFTGVHDDIYVRCLLMQAGGNRILVISMELGDLGEIDQWQEKISHTFNIPKESIFLTVTHNHLAPHVSDDYMQDVVDVEKTQEFGKLVWSVTQEAIAASFERMCPVKVAFGTGSCDVNVNRDLIRDGRSTMAPNPHGISDKTVAVLKIEDLEGNPLAFLCNYAVHGVVMFDSKQKGDGMLISGDLPGEVCRILEKRHDDETVVLFTSGAAGDQIPRYMSHRLVHDGKGGFTRVDAGVTGWVLLQVQAENLSDEIMLISENSLTTLTNISLEAVQKKYIVPGQKRAERPMDVPDDYMFEDYDSVTMPLGLFMVGPVCFVCIPAEPVCSIGKKLKESLGLEHVVLITHCNGSLSYISDDWGYRHKTFEAVVSHFKQGQGCNALIEGAKELLQTLTKTRGDGNYGRL